MLGRWAIFVIIFAVLFSTSFTMYASAQTDEKIPSWIKTIAGLWAKGQLTDSEYLEITQFLIDNGFLTTSQEETISRTSLGPPLEIGETLPSNPFPNPALKYTPELEWFEEDPPYIKGLVTLKNVNGFTSEKSGKYTLSIFNSNGDEVFKDRKYVSQLTYSRYDLESTNGVGSAFTWVIIPSRFNSLATPSGTAHLTFQDTSGNIYTNEIPVDGMPFDIGPKTYEKESFPNSKYVDKILEVGPFWVTVNDVGKYREDSAVSEEFFRVDLSVQNKRESAVKFLVQEVIIMDQNLKLYSAEPHTITDLEKMIPSNGIRDGTILFEKIPAGISKIKLFLSIEVIEDANLSVPYKYNDIIEISLR